MARILIVENNSSIVQDIEKALRRFNHKLYVVDNKLQALRRLRRSKFHLVVLDTDVVDPSDHEFLEWQRQLKEKDNVPILLLVGMKTSYTPARMDFRSEDRLAKPFNTRELVSRINAILHEELRMACIGGGTGLYTLLLGLKTINNLHIMSIVSMSDDGGSSGRLREAYGILPPGDIRRSLVALSAAPDLMKKMLEYRFQKGKGLKGHNLGNFILMALSQISGSMVEAVRESSELLNINGIIMPVTTTLNTLKAEFEDGTIVTGETHIDVPAKRDPHLKIKRLWQDPTAYANPDAVSALLHSEVITIGPGDLFTSLISNLVVTEIAEAIRRSRARKIYVTNLMTKPGETMGYTLADHIEEVQKYLGEDCLDYVVVSDTKLSRRATAEYKKKGQEPVRIDPPSVLHRITKARVIKADITSEEDLVRHDSIKLARVIQKIIQEI